jgi:hypothetical protein
MFAVAVAGWMIARVEAAQTRSDDPTVNPTSNTDMLLKPDAVRLGSNNSSKPLSWNCNG